MSVESAAASPRAPRGRPRQDGLAETRRKQIVRSAYAVLTVKGYEQTSIADIAHHARVGHGTVYRYFADKRELLDHVFDYAVAKTVSALNLGSLTQADVGDFEQSLELIEVFGWRLFAMIDADPGVLQLITVESSAIDPELRHRVIGMISALDAGMGLMFDAASPDWSKSADTRVRNTFGHMMLAMAGPGLVLSLTQTSGTIEARRSCLRTVAAIANRGLLTPTEADPADGSCRQGGRGDPCGTIAELPREPWAENSFPDCSAAPPTNTKARRRSELYAAAWALFLERGYRDVDVADITARARVSQGTFYNYFTNKRSLLDLMIAQVGAEVADAMSTGASPAAATTRDDYVAAIDGVATRVIAYVAAQGPEVSFVALTAPGVDREAFFSTLSGFLAMGTRIAAMLDHGRLNGWVRGDVDLAVAGQAVACCVVAAVLPALLDDAHIVDVEVSSKVCVSYMLGGMRAAAAVHPSDRRPR